MNNRPHEFEEVLKEARAIEDRFIEAEKKLCIHLNNPDFVIVHIENIVYDFVKKNKMIDYFDSEVDIFELADFNTHLLNEAVMKHLVKNSRIIEIKSRFRTDYFVKVDSEFSKYSDDTHYEGCENE
jgi:hypothetical protein